MHNTPCLAHNLLENFLEMLSAERNVSLNTMISYKNDLKHFLHFIKQYNVSLEQCNEETFNSYLLDLNSRSFMGKTIQRKFSAIKQFFQFLVEEKIVSTNTAINLDLPKKEHSIPRALLQDDMTKLIEASYLDDSNEGIRFCAMLEILYSSGLRITELVTLKIQCLQRRGNIIEPFMIIKGKGSKERLIILHEKAIAMLTKYLSIRHVFIKNNTTTHWMFPSYTKDGKSTHISRQRFGQLLKELAVQAGIDHTKISPHKIRHSFASHLLENGANLRTVQELLGHSDISSTQIYTKVLSKNLKKLVFEKHPLADTKSHY